MAVITFGLLPMAESLKYDLQYNITAYIKIIFNYLHHHKPIKFIWKPILLLMPIN